jgi:hypothetical protein
MSPACNKKGYPLLKIVIGWSDSPLSLVDCSWAAVNLREERTSFQAGRRNMCRVSACFVLMFYAKGPKF